MYYNPVDNQSRSLRDNCFDGYVAVAGVQQFIETNTEVPLWAMISQDETHVALLLPHNRELKWIVFEACRPQELDGEGEVWIEGQDPPDVDLDAPEIPQLPFFGGKLIQLWGYRVKE